MPDKRLTCNGHMDRIHAAQPAPTFEHRIAPAPD